MNLGFTGTQHGMTPAQQNAVLALLAKIKTRFPEIELHHGDCIGSDTEMHQAFQRIMGPDAKIIIHPPTNDAKRSFCKPAQEMEAKPYLDRNRDIVDATDGMIATPGEAVEQVRSGTWSTVRYALRKGRKVSLVLPSGEIRLLVP